jgi:predicted transposase/invertase (TIGR01784 family)
MIEKGMEKGIEKGIEKNNLEVAQKMLENGISILMVRKVTGLSVSKITALKNKKTKNSEL